MRQLSVTTNRDLRPLREQKQRTVGAFHSKYFGLIGSCKFIAQASHTRRLRPIDSLEFSKSLTDICWGDCLLCRILCNLLRRTGRQNIWWSTLTDANSQLRLWRRYVVPYCESGSYLGTVARLFSLDIEAFIAISICVNHIHERSETRCKLRLRMLQFRFRCRSLAQLTSCGLFTVAHKLKSKEQCALLVPEKSV